MRLSWNEIRVRAAHFADQWKLARYEKGESQTFYNEFFEIFGVTRRRVANFEEPVKRLGDARGFIDLFWKGVLLVEQKSAGRDLVRAKQQAFDYFPGLKEQELPRYLLLSDFQTFELYDLDENTHTSFFGRSRANQLRAGRSSRQKAEGSRQKAGGRRRTRARIMSSENRLEQIEIHVYCNQHTDIRR